MSDLAAALAAYLASHMPDAAGLQVEDLARIHGGSSQETYRFRARWEEAGVPIERRLILRREPPSGLVVAERDLEYIVYRALEGQGIPAPGVHFLELDPKWLERPFFIMDMAPGRAGNPFLSSDPYGGHGDRVARQF